MAFRSIKMFEEKTNSMYSFTDQGWLHNRLRKIGMFWFFRVVVYCTLSLFVEQRYPNRVGYRRLSSGEGSKLSCCSIFTSHLFAVCLQNTCGCRLLLCLEMYARRGKTWNLQLYSAQGDQVVQKNVRYVGVLDLSSSNRTQCRGVCVEHDNNAFFLR